MAGLVVNGCNMIDDNLQPLWSDLFLSSQAVRSSRNDWSIWVFHALDIYCMVIERHAILFNLHTRTNMRLSQAVVTNFFVYVMTDTNTKLAQKRWH